MEQKREIIGYKLKDEKYREAVQSFVNLKNSFNDDEEVVLKPNYSWYKIMVEEGIIHWFTPIYKEEPKLEIGRWYKIQSHDTNWIMCFNGWSTGYGFNTGGHWNDNYRMLSTQPWQPATDKEVEEALIKEAKKRGFKEGVTFDKQNLYTIKTSHAIVTGGFKYWAKYNMLDVQAMGSYPGKHTIFENGTWATIISEEKPTKEDILKQIEDLKEKINLL